MQQRVANDATAQDGRIEHQRDGEKNTPRNN